MPPITRLAVLLFALALDGCASLYFYDAGAPPSPPPQYRLEHWPYGEYWTGIVFNGQKIGFSHLSITADGAQPGRYVLTSEAAFRLRFLGIDKQFQIRAVDRVRDDLTLEQFDYEYLLDGNRLRVEGRVEDRTLRARVSARGAENSLVASIGEPVYPTAVIPLYAPHAGLALGRTYSYLVFDGETQQVSPLTQRIERYERSEVFAGQAFKTSVEFLGQRSTLWIDAGGLPVFELALNGVLISALEDEDQARRYLAAASVNKQDVLLDFSLVRTDRAIEQPRAVSRLTLELSGVTTQTPIPSDARQRCVQKDRTVLCEIRRQDARAVSATPDGTAARYLSPSLAAPSTDPQIRTLARSIAQDETDPLRRIERIQQWLARSIEKQAVDAFSALDVLEGKRAECQGHTYLYTALARALEIPTRMVNGLLYSDSHGGFAYHTWAESHLNGQWLAVDPTLGQLSADATHLKLNEGETQADLLPLLDYVGRVQIKVESFDTAS